jgi:hypothetical protein
MRIRARPARSGQAAGIIVPGSLLVVHRGRVRSVSPTLIFSDAPERDQVCPGSAPAPGISGRQCCSSSFAFSRPSSSRGLLCPVRRWRNTVAMNSSIAAVTLSMGRGSGLSSVIEVACHGKGSPWFLRTPLQVLGLIRQASAGTGHPRCGTTGTVERLHASQPTAGDRLGGTQQANHSHGCGVHHEAVRPDDLEANHRVANTTAELITCGSFASIEVTEEVSGDPNETA